MKKRKRRYHKIRGLRRCQNAKCGVILHRDRNAASNIADNFYRLYEGKPCLGKLTTQETALYEALGKLDDSFGSIIQPMQLMKGTAHAIDPISKSYRNGL